MTCIRKWVKRSKQDFPFPRPGQLRVKVKQRYDLNMEADYKMKDRTCQSYIFARQKYELKRKSIGEKL